MKQILLPLLLLPYLAFAQEVKRDSVWLSAGFDSTRMIPVYYQHKLYEYDNGESDIKVRIIGDSVQAIGNVVSQELDAIRHLSEQAAAVIAKNQVINEWQDMHANTIAVGLANMAGVIQDMYEGIFLGNCTVRENGIAEPATISKNAQNAIRISYKGKTYRIFIFADTMIRILNYPNAGDFLDLYQINPKSYSDITKTFILRVK